MPQLLVNEKGAERTVDLAETVVHIGRAPENQIVINDARSSRKHCQLSRTPQGWVLEDLKSRNGTLLNGAAVEKQFLKDGDEFAIGTTRFRFHAESAPPAAEDPAADGDELEADAVADELLDLPEEDRPPAGAVTHGPETVRFSDAIRLEGLAGDHAGQRIAISGFPFTIGRAGDNDFRIADKKASGHHARVIERDGKLYLEDLQSRNGTFLNDRKVAGARPLAAGSTIRIGESSFRMEMPAEAAGEAGAEDVEVEPEAAAEVDGHAAEADFSRFDAREFLREGERASPLSVAVILLVLGTFLYFAVDVTLEKVRPKDRDPPEERNAVANWSFEEPSEKGAIPGWALAEGSEGTLTLSAEGAQYPGQRALRLRPAGAGKTRAASLREIPVDPREEYRVAAHVTNLGSFAAGVSVSWLAESGGKRVEVGRDWGAAVREETRQEDLERVVVPPPSAVFARLEPFVIDPESGSGGSGAAFDRIVFASAGKQGGAAEDASSLDTAPAETASSQETEKEAVLPLEVRNGSEEAAMVGGPPAGLPIRLKVHADGVLRDLRRGSRMLLSSLWVGLGAEADPLALGPRFITRLKEAGEREGVLLLSNLPDTRKGDWIPLETRVQGQGGEIQCEFRLGRGRSSEPAAPDRLLLYLECAPGLKEIQAFGGALKSPATFPPDHPEPGPVEELQIGTQGEQTVMIFRPPVTLRAIPHPDVKDRSLLVAEAALAAEAEARGRKGTSAVFLVRISPLSRREDEAVAAILRDAASLHREGKPAEARERLKELETRYPWRAADIARGAELVKGWNEEGEKAVQEVEAGLSDLAASPSPVIRDALLARVGMVLQRFQETPARARLVEAEKKIRSLIPPEVRAADTALEPLLKEARAHLDRGEIGLADLCLQLARASKLTSREEEDLGHLAQLVAERRKQRASEEVR
jgi:pSer/pThr/pTyr-binding forkhead associated (FHA) protein